LVNAHILFNQGKFEQAAVIFERLANIAEARGGPRAPRFYLQAGRSRMHAMQTDSGIQLIRHARQLAIANGTWGRLSGWIPVLQEELKLNGLDERILSGEPWFEEAIPRHDLAQPNRRPQLSLKCPSCGGPVLPNEVDWIDEMTAECTFCGSLLRGT
jgi:hypothetical protein